MKINGTHYQTIWLKDEQTVQTFDQRFLPHQLVIEDLVRLEDFVTAIREMHVRGAPLIGVTAAYGLYIAAREALNEPDFDHYFSAAAKRLAHTRPTAIDLFHAIGKVSALVHSTQVMEERPRLALEGARLLAEESVQSCRSIGEHGLALIQQISARKQGAPVHILTHCNAGWIACIDYGTATAPIYLAHDAGIPVHVWVDETRPRNQGANLTAFELLSEQIESQPVAMWLIKLVLILKRWQPKTMAYLFMWPCPLLLLTGKPMMACARYPSSSATPQK